jgi:hypothetical protein
MEKVLAAYTCDKEDAAEGVVRNLVDIADYILLFMDKPFNPDTMRITEFEEVDDFGKLQYGIKLTESVFLLDYMWDNPK